MIISYKLDILKPHNPSHDEVARTLIHLKGVNYVSIVVDEIDQKTTSVFMKIRGTEEMSLDEIQEKLEELNCALHSVDEVTVDNSMDQITIKKDD